MTWDQHAANLATIVVGLGVLLGAIGWLVRRSARRLESFIDDRLTDANGVSLSKRLDDHIQDSEKRQVNIDARFKVIEVQAERHEEAVEMWKALGKIAEAAPPGTA